MLSFFSLSWVFDFAFSSLCFSFSLINFPFHPNFGMCVELFLQSPPKNSLLSSAGLGLLRLGEICPVLCHYWFLSPKILSALFPPCHLYSSALSFHRYNVCPHLIPVLLNPLSTDLNHKSGIPVQLGILQWLPAVFNLKSKLLMLQHNRFSISSHIWIPNLIFNLSKLKDYAL